MIVLHLVANLLALFSVIMAVIFAKRHNLRRHHFFIFVTIVLMTFAVGFMLVLFRGLANVHCILGLAIYIYVSFTLLSGILFRRRKLSRNVHRIYGILAISLVAAQIFYGLLKSRFFN